jgi:cytidylate kinase
MYENTEKFLNRMLSMEEFLDIMKKDPRLAENTDKDTSRLIEWEKNVIPVKTPFYNNKVKEP